MRHLRILPVIIICLAFIIGCPPQNRIVPDEIKAEYTFAEAQAWYTPKLEKYNTWFKVADLNTKRNWARNISPLWDKAGDIMVEWEKAVDSNQPFAQTKVELFKKYKSQILMALPALMEDK
jgi:hypothetical protein